MDNQPMNAPAPNPAPTPAPKPENGQKKAYGSGYGKRPLWQWIALYVVIGGLIYWAIYYFAFARRGYSYKEQPGTPAPTGAMPINGAQPPANPSGAPQNW